MGGHPLHPPDPQRLSVWVPSLQADRSCDSPGFGFFQILPLPSPSTRKAISGRPLPSLCSQNYKLPLSLASSGYNNIHRLSGAFGNMENVTSLLKDFLLAQNGIGERKGKRMSLSIPDGKDTRAPAAQIRVGTRSPQRVRQRQTDD